VSNKGVISYEENIMTVELVMNSIFRDFPGLREDLVARLPKNTELGVVSPKLGLVSGRKFWRGWAALRFKAAEQIDAMPENQWSKKFSSKRVRASKPTTVKDQHSDFHRNLETPLPETAMTAAAQSPTTTSTVKSHD
jgi:hypothetical protein